MAPSTTSTSISKFLMSPGTLLVLEPLRQTNAHLKSANEVLVLINEMVLAYCSHFLIAISCAKLLWYMHQALFPIPPVVVMTKGVNVPCSTSKTLFESFFSFSWIRWICCCSRSLYDTALGWQTLTSKNADRCRSQRPRAWISNLAFWSTGSISTSLCNILRNSASRSLGSLWRWIIKPPSRIVVYSITEFPLIQVKALILEGKRCKSCWWSLFCRQI